MQSIRARRVLIERNVIGAVENFLPTHTEADSHGDSCSQSDTALSISHISAVDGTLPHWAGNREGVVYSSDCKYEPGSLYRHVSQEGVTSSLQDTEGEAER
jgi:hypothetical protein